MAVAHVIYGAQHFLGQAEVGEHGAVRFRRRAICDRDIGRPFIRLARMLVVLAAVVMSGCRYGLDRRPRVWMFGHWFRGDQRMRNEFGSDRFGGNYRGGDRLLWTRRRVRGCAGGGLVSRHGDWCRDK